MLKIRKDYNLDNLKDFGFKLEPEGSYYYYKLDDFSKVTAQKTKSKDFKEREVGIESQCGIYINHLKIIYDLILLGIIVED